MIVLDTNVLSEIIKPQPSKQVAQWIESQPRAILFTTTMTRAELLYGIALLPDGKRKAQIYAAIIKILDTEFQGKIIGFDNDAADCYAAIASLRKKSGKPISQLDAMIAAITQSRGAQLATRNVKDFVDCAIAVVNPWGD